VQVHVQALAADDISIVQRGMPLLPALANFRPAAAAKALAQPLLQLLAPAVMHCLQQQQQQQGCSDTVEQYGIVVTVQQAKQLMMAEQFLGVLCVTCAEGTGDSTGVHMLDDRIVNTC
jgi:hypothetical protein